VTGAQAPPGNRNRPAPQPGGIQSSGDQTSSSIESVTLTLDEYGQLCELMFNLGASFAAMQLHAEQEDIRSSEFVRQMWKTPRFAELERRRQHSDEPCRLLSCHGRCSRCIRADAVRRGAVRS
jgi:hypothetical protein